MKISIDDWHFRPSTPDSLVVDVFLGNAQHALLEVYPMKDHHSTNGQVPEMVVFCEFPGEKLAEHSCVARWISRPPDRSCPWSNVEVPPALMQQIRERLGYLEQVNASAAA